MNTRKAGFETGINEVVHRGNGSLKRLPILIIFGM